MNLYLDIDGVILTKKQTLPSHLSTFIEFVTTTFDCYWLTTHCRNGENKAIPYLQQFLLEADLEKLKTVRPIHWDTLKKKGLDFNNHFIWLEDAPFTAEKQILEKHQRIDNLIIVNLNRPDELLAVMDRLKRCINSNP